MGIVALIVILTMSIFFQGTNDLREMKYPKVQKYCLMSVRGCYTGKNFSKLLSLLQMISNKSYKEWLGWESTIEVITNTFYDN